jgi:hypothetical protein
MSCNPYTSRLIVLFVMLCFVMSVTVDTESRAESSASESTSTASKSSGAPPMDEIKTRTVKITAAESKDHDLPAAEISLDLAKTGMSGKKFPKEGDYLSLSGPPGPPLGMKISLVEEMPESEDQWRDLVEKRYPKRAPDSGTIGEIEFADGVRPAFTCTIPHGPKKAHHLFVVLAIPESEKGILVDFYRGGGKTSTPSPVDMAKLGDFAELSPSFSIRFE